jgi:hypothetical protein
MKNSILLLSMLIFAVACSKNNDGEKDDCIDVSQINNSGVCYEVYAPVCGCNNETYENDCKAQIKGVLNFTEGACG